MKMKAIILLNLFIPIFSLISNTKPVIINLNHNDAEKTITKWAKHINHAKMPLYNFYPLYDMAIQLNKRSLILEQEKRSDEILLGCRQLFFGADHKGLSHICLCSITNCEDYHTLSINKILLNPSIISRIDENDVLNTTLQFKYAFYKFSKRYNLRVDESKLLKWDNGRFYLLLNEDIL